jgi:ANTAR domain
MDAEPGADQPGEQERRLRRLVSSLRAHGGVSAVSAACHSDVPGVDGVVLAVLAAHVGRIIISDSGLHGDQLEDLHATLGEGPGIDAAVTGEPVTAVDLNRPQAHMSWPRFTAQALTCGIRTVVAYPVLLNAQPLGVLSLYRANPGPLSAAEHQRADQYAHAATALLLDRQGVTGARQMSVTLPIQAAEVQQAVGVVMESAGVDAATALHRLRAYAHHSARPMRDVVAEVRTCRLPFDPTTPL